MERKKLMEEQLTDRLSLKLDEGFNKHAGSPWFTLKLIDNATGLSLAVGEPYYTTKYKAEKGFTEALGFLKHSLQLKDEAA